MKITLQMDLNEAQLNTLQRMVSQTAWRDSIDVIVRKDGNDYIFEADYLDSIKIIDVVK